MKLSKYIKNSQGFTLIELLIVIAVIGVLAAVVLVAINPIEQLSRARDTGRKSSVTQLGHAMEAYVTTSGGTYPVASASWQTNLVTSGELKNVITASAGATACAAGSSQGGFCYAQLSSGTDAVIWTLTESSSERTKASCTSGQVVAEAWIASQGKTGVTCLTNAATAPVAGATLN